MGTTHAAPLLGKTIDFSLPYVDWADTKIELAADKCKQVKDDIVSSDVGQQVAGKLSEKVVKPAEALITNAVNTWRGNITLN
jgi:predicted alpha/beta hydrolase